MRLSRSKLERRLSELGVRLAECGWQVESLRSQREGERRASDAVRRRVHELEAAIEEHRRASPIFSRTPADLQLHAKLPTSPPADGRVARAQARPDAPKPGTCPRCGAEGPCGCWSLITPSTVGAYDIERTYTVGDPGPAKATVTPGHPDEWADTVDLPAGHLATNAAAPFDAPFVGRPIPYATPTSCDCCGKPVRRRPDEDTEPGP